MEIAVRRNKEHAGDLHKVVEVTCLSCRRSFKTTYAGRKYCTPTCRTVHLASTAKCIRCGVLLASTDAKTLRGYCSDTCREASLLDKAIAQGRYVPCTHCGKNHIRKGKEASYCSDACKDAKVAERKEQRERDKANKPVKEKPPKRDRSLHKYCAVCRIRLTAASAESGAVCCSPKCYDVYEQKQSDAIRPLPQKQLKAMQKQILSATLKTEVSSVSHICVKCRTSQKKCVRFKSQFTVIPDGAELLHVEGKEVIVTCPKYT